MKLKSLRQECHKWIDLTNESRNWVCEWTIRCGRSSLVVILSDRSDQRCRYLRDDFIVQYPRYQKFPPPPRSLAISDTSKIPSDSQVLCPTFGKQQHRSLFVILWLYRQMDNLRLTLDVCYPNNSRCPWYRGKNVMLLISSIFLALLIAVEKFELKDNGYHWLIQCDSTKICEIYYCVCVYTHKYYV